MARYLFEFSVGVTQSTEGAQSNQEKESLFFDADNMEHARSKARVLRSDNPASKLTGKLYELRPIAL